MRKHVVFTHVNKAWEAPLRGLHHNLLLRLELTASIMLKKQVTCGQSNKNQVDGYLFHSESSKRDSLLLPNAVGLAAAGATRDNALPATSYTLTGPIVRESIRIAISPLASSQVSHTHPGGTIIISPLSLATSSSPATAAMRRMPSAGWSLASRF